MYWTDERDQFYTVHTDYMDDSHMHLSGPRILTIFIYLNDVEEGGETRFEWSNITVTPKVGRVAIWPSVLDEDPSEYDERTMHESMPVTKGEKYGANAWLHLRSHEKAMAIDC